MGLRGGGKRGRCGAGSNKVSKAEKLAFIKQELSVIMLHLNTMTSHPLVPPIIIHIQQFIAQSETRGFIVNRLGTLTEDALDKALNSMGGHKEDCRIKSISKFLFGQDTADITHNQVIMATLANAIN